MPNAERPSSNGSKWGSHLNVVLRLFLDQSYPLEHIGDVIYAALLHVQRSCRLVEIEYPLRRILDQRDKLFRQQPEAAVIAARLLLGHCLHSEEAPASQAEER